MPRLGMRDTRPLLEVRGGPGGVSKDSIIELWLFREVLWAFVVRQIKVSYKQASVGIGWAVVQPVFSAILFAIFLGRLAHVPSDGAPYLLFALTGMVGWTFFANATGSGMGSLVTDQALLRKVYFPREVLPLAAVAAALVDLLIGLVTLGVFAAFNGRLPDVTWIGLLFPVAILLSSAMALAVGLSALNVYYRDVRYALPFVLQIALFATPVVYPLRLVPSAWRSAYAALNPVAGAIDGLRRIILHHAWPQWDITTGALIWSMTLVVAGFVLFKRLERGFSDRV